MLDSLKHGFIPIEIREDLSSLFTGREGFLARAKVLTYQTGKGMDEIRIRTVFEQIVLSESHSPE